MNVLSKCSRAYGHVKVCSGSPEIEIYRNVLYDGKGLYDWRRRLIPNAAQFQGVRLPDRMLGEPFQKRTTELDPERVKNEAPDDVYIWGGPLTNHYGHFLLDTLSRLAFLQGMPPVHPKVLFWSNEPVDNRSLRGFQRTLFDLIGLDSSEIIILDKPTFIKEVLIQAPSFECNSYVYTSFADFCHHLGDRIMNGQTTPSTQPVYVGKHNLTSGVARLTNEIALVEYLDRAGIKIISPELLSFEQQVALWKNHETITGYLGSATHTALFAKNRNIALLNHENQVYSNQIMIDIACNHRSEYYSVANNLEKLSSGEGFQLNFQMSSPEAVGEQWLRVVDKLCKGNVPSMQFGFRTIDLHTYIDEPFGQNLSLGRAADQSSIFSPHSEGETTVTDAERAVDGCFHERYAFHTKLEENPWWQVDLGSVCTINEIRIFNRLDIGNENSRAFHILFSEDGTEFITRHTRDGEPFGAVTGKPYRWVCETVYTTRFVRIQLIGIRYMHLVQVEVFGENLSSIKETR